MTHFHLNPSFVRQYKNNGQHMEQWTRFSLTGEIAKADNLTHDLGTDCLGYQIKSARATVCKGTDIKAYLATDMATEYIYATADGIAYIMSRTEYIEFVEVFGTVTKESTRNGGAEKIRLKSESVALLTYLAERGLEKALSPEGDQHKKQRKEERKMKVFEKLESLGLDYYINLDSEIIIYGEGDEYEDGNDRKALDEMREWVENNKTPHHDSSVYIEGYLVIFQEDEQYPDYL